MLSKKRISTCGQELTGLEHVLGAKFQRRVAQDCRRWNKEWLRYLSGNRDYRFYFADFDTPSYALAVGPAKIRDFTPEEVYLTKLYKHISAQVWVSGDNLVGKTVVEMGCGPGMFGRLASRFTRKYIGIDASTLALQIAELTAPAERCTYVHLGNVEKISELAKVADTAVGRNFFIHHNYEDALWIVRFLRDLTKSGGVISADFYHFPERVGEARRYSARDPLDPQHASAVYNFEYHDIEELAGEAGVELLATAVRPDLERCFATMLVR